MRQMQGLQHQMRRLVQRVVVTVAEGQRRAGEATRAVADEIDDRSKFGSHRLKTKKILRNAVKDERNSAKYRETLNKSKSRHSRGSGNPVSWKIERACKALNPRLRGDDNLFRPSIGETT